MISHHKGSVAQALADLFPDIGFQKSLLWSRGTLFYFFRHFFVSILIHVLFFNVYFLQRFGEMLEEGGGSSRTSLK